MDKQDRVGKSWDLTVPEDQVDIVLIDDDPIFCSLMAEHARRMSVNLHFFHDLLEVQESGNLQKYQVAILDYQLEQMNGLEVAQWIPMFFNDMPIVLISYEDRTQENTNTTWPGSVRAFVHKREGVKAILSQALALRDQLKREEQFKQRVQEEKTYGPYRWMLRDSPLKKKVEENIHTIERIIARNVHRVVDRLVRHKEPGRYDDHHYTSDQEIQNHVEREVEIETQRQNLRHGSMDSNAFLMAAEQICKGMNVPLHVESEMPRKVMNQL